MGGLRTSTSAAFALFSLLPLYATQHLPPTLSSHNTRAPLAAAYFLLGLCVNGPKTLSGIALRQLVPPSMAGTAMGVQGLVGQVGASWAGAPVGFVAQHWGWGAIRHLWAASLVAAAGSLSVPGLLVKARRVAALQREKGGKEGPLLKLFNYYLPPTLEEREAAEAKRAVAAAAAAAAENEEEEEEGKERMVGWVGSRRNSRSTSTTLGGLLQRRRRRGQTQEQQQSLEQQPAATVARRGRRVWRSLRRQQEEEEEEHEEQKVQEEATEGETNEQQGGVAEEEEEDESQLTLRQRITRRMRQRLREVTTVGEL